VFDRVFPGMPGAGRAGSRNGHLISASLAALLAVSVAGCAGQKQVVKEEPVPVRQEVPKEEPKPEPTRVLEFQKAYFAYDRYYLTDAAKEGLKKSVDALLASPDVKVNVDGHCDERGTDGYNMELGWKRAYAVRDYMKKLGIDEGRMFTSSFGRSRPAVAGNDESVWSKNRRVEITERR